MSILRVQLSTHYENMILSEGHLLHMNLMSDKVVEQGGSLGFTTRASGVCLTYNKELPVASDQADGFLGGLDVDHLAPDIIQVHHLLLVVATPDVEGLHLSHPPGGEYGFFQISKIQLGQGFLDALLCLLVEISPLVVGMLGHIH